MLGKNYKEWKNTANNKLESDYYKSLYTRISGSDLQNHVIFDNHSDQPEIWFSKIGYILSVSDIEGSHQAVAEGMVTGSIPIIYGKALTIYKLDELYPKKYCHYGENINYLCDTIKNYTTDDNLRILESKYCKKYGYDNFKIDVIKNKYDDLFKNI